jgi:hypothetical protein
VIIWYTTVGFGGTPTPIGPWKDPQEVADVLNRWLRRKGHKAGQLVNAHNTRVYGYTTRAAARDGYISDSPGRSGNISVAGIYDFLAAVGEKDGPAKVERPVYPSKLSKLRLAGPVPRPEFH